MTQAGASTDEANDVPTLAPRPFIDPAWLPNLAKSKPADFQLQSLQFVMFMAKNNPDLLKLASFRYFVTALYSCDSLALATANEFDRDKVPSQAIERLTAFLATQPDQFTWQSDDDLGEWKRDTQTMAWDQYDNKTYLPVTFMAGARTQCGPRTIQALASNEVEKEFASVNAANIEQVKEGMPPIRMDEQAARAFVSAHPDRKVKVSTIFVSTPQDPRFTQLSYMDKYFSPKVVKVTITDPTDNRVLSAADF